MFSSVVGIVSFFFLQSTVVDERALLTAASIGWSSEFVFVPSSAGSECVVAVGCLLSELIGTVFYKEKQFM